MTTLAELRERHKKLIEDQDKGPKGEGGSDFAIFTPGDNWIRILPGKEEDLDFYVESAIHKYVDSEGKYRNYQCRKTAGEICPLCELHYDLWNRHRYLKLPRGEKSKFGTLATAIKPKERFYIKAVVRALQEKGEQPVKFVAMSKELFDRVMAALTNPDLTDEDNPDKTTIISLDRGNDFNVRITKKGEYNSFVESEPKIKKTKAGTPQEILAWTETNLNLKTLIKIGDYEEGKKIAQNMEATLYNVKTDVQTPPKSDDDNESKFKQGLQA